MHGCPCRGVNISERRRVARFRLQPTLSGHPLRLTQIKLAGFKSFVDPTAISTPGQLVGIVGPNGCGKSNVIDAVRWVLGESKASALRGESMQDVIFNGAGERKPVGRASVELFFDNSAGRIGGQWGQYAELSIKRVLTRDGDSTYYINNIPVRRRDIHDLFLGTGLGPRAYAIIEQGMISRVIEAKPEELRVFLEEAAGVSKYKERRKETEGRLADARDNLARVEDIRVELGTQLEKLDAQAKVATEYREHETRLKQVQQLQWFSKQQDAVAARERHTSAIATLTVAFDGLQAEVRAAEAKQESLRADHYAAGDALHEKQGAYYEANAEVTRLEQQLTFARESETRISQQAAQLTEQLAALSGQEGALAGERKAAEAALEQALAAREAAAADEQAAAAAVPAVDETVRQAEAVVAELQERISQGEQAIRVSETRRESHANALAQLAQRRERLESEQQGLAAPVTSALADIEEQLAQETGELKSKEQALGALRESVQDLQERQRTAGEAARETAARHADLDARAQALSALQAKIGEGEDTKAWQEARGLSQARRLWQGLDIEPRLGRCARSGIARAPRCDRARSPRHREPVARQRRGCASRPNGGLRHRARHRAGDRVGRRAARTGPHGTARRRATPRGLARRRALPRQRRGSTRRPRRARRRRSVRHAARSCRHRPGGQLLRAG